MLVQKPAYWVRAPALFHQLRVEGFTSLTCKCFPFQYIYLQICLYMFSHVLILKIDMVTSLSSERISLPNLWKIVIRESNYEKVIMCILKVLGDLQSSLIFLI